MKTELKDIEATSEEGQQVKGEDLEKFVVDFDGPE
jgi:hypothetical protein